MILKIIGEVPVLKPYFWKYQAIYKAEPHICIVIPNQKLMLIPNLGSEGATEECNTLKKMGRS